MKTLKDLRSLKRVKAKRIVKGMYCLEDIDLMREALKQEIQARFGVFRPELWSESESSFNYDNRFVMKPKVKRESIGELEFRSKDYVFYSDNKSSYGTDLKADMMTDFGFQVVTSNGSIFEYHLINE